MTTALVLGGALSVWADASNALGLFEPAMTVAVNDIGAAWSGPIDIWASLHPEKFPVWCAQRERRGFAPAGELVGHEIAGGAHRAVDYRWPGMNTSGSSGLFAVKLAIEAGADRVVLAGVPMAPEGAHFFTTAPWTERDSFIAGWQAAMPFITGKVRSMSGTTKDWLGVPTPEWLHG